MPVHVANAYSAVSPLAISARSQASPSVAGEINAVPAANTSARVTISQAARDLLAAQADSAGAKPPSRAVFATDKGNREIDIEAYFSPPTGNFDLLSQPLLAPTQGNIEALSRHLSTAFPQFLSRNDIPAAPASITYDNHGQVQLPADYPYAEEFKQALANDPAMARELSTVNALTSSLVEMNKSIPFQQEYAAATSSAEIDAVVAKYSYLFSNNRHHDSIALHFSATGSLSITADGKPVFG